VLGRQRVAQGSRSGCDRPDRSLGRLLVPEIRVASNRPADRLAGRLRIHAPLAEPLSKISQKKDLNRLPRPLARACAAQHMREVLLECGYSDARSTLGGRGGDRLRTTARKRSACPPLARQPPERVMNAAETRG